MPTKTWKKSSRPRKAPTKRDVLILRTGNKETVFEPRFSRPAERRARYFELVRQFPLRHLRNDKDLDVATEIMNSLIVKDRLSREEQDYLDVLSDLIERYEDEHHPIPNLEPREFLSESIKSKGITQTELAKATGISAAVISNILAGRRDMTLEHIQAFARYFHYSPECFMAMAE
ncbi:MAG: helix-turn-helix domain-containing protein [Planctomycetaceae bacterium]|nr:helix-turn-helix domain-containing protein [Planctomycetaceae bacterium]